MNRTRALSYVSFYLDDALSVREQKDMPADARLVGWQCGFEPLFVAVWSYLGVKLDDMEAEDIARDYLIERGWFADEQPTDADYII